MHGSETTHTRKKVSRVRGEFFSEGFEWAEKEEEEMVGLLCSGAPLPPGGHIRYSSWHTSADNAATCQGLQVSDTCCSSG